MKRRYWFLAFLVLLVLPLAALAADATTASGEPAAGTEPESVFTTVIVGGGPIGWVIILLSIVSLSLIIEHFFSIRREVLCPPEVLGTVESLFDGQDYEEALTVVETDPSYLAKVLEAGLARAPNLGAMAASMASAQEEQTTKLRHKISYLGLIGNIAPMLGLFGTVLGMMLAFSEIETTTSMPRPAQLAHGIKTALVTTFLGLFVAIPALSAFSLFRNRIEAVMAEVTTITEELMQGFRRDGDAEDDEE